MPLERPTHVIVGASLAGAKAAETLRADGSDARISPNFLAIVADPTVPAIDRSAARAAVRDLLAALGQDTDDAELADTPRRVVAAFEELLTPAPFR